MYFKFEIPSLLIKSYCTVLMKSHGNHKEIRDLKLQMNLSPSSEGVRRSADMQTRSIFVGLNDPDISMSPKHFILLASQKNIFPPDIVVFRPIRVPTFLSLSLVRFLLPRHQLCADNTGVSPELLSNSAFLKRF